MKKPKKITCGQYMAARAAENRDRQVEQLFNDTERQALRDRLSIDAAQRERSNDEESQAAR
jgi:hypothetical protein